MIISLLTWSNGLSLDDHAVIISLLTWSNGLLHDDHAAISTLFTWVAIHVLYFWLMADSETSAVFSGHKTSSLPELCALYWQVAVLFASWYDQYIDLCDLFNTISMSASGVCNVSIRIRIMALFDDLIFNSLMFFPQPDECYDLFSLDNLFSWSVCTQFPYAYS